MTPLLTPEGYAQTKTKLANMHARLASLRARTDISTIHLREVESSYLDMIRQYRRELKLYEAVHGQAGPETAADGSSGEVPASDKTQRGN